MSSTDKLQLIRERLIAHFQPNYLHVNDDSELHKGHAGYQNGGSHFSIHIAAASLSKQSRVAAHRKIYALFADLIPDQIHALSIKIFY